MSYSIALLKRGFTPGYEAEIDNDNLDSIAGGRTMQDACRRAAKRLRILALRFEILSTESGPGNATTQTRVNHMSVADLRERRNSKRTETASRVHTGGTPTEKPAAKVG